VGNVSRIKQIAQAEDVREKGSEKDVWASECGSNKGMEKFHNDELNDSHSPSNIIAVFTFDRIRGPEHVVRTGENRII
jgi:hypothetical protein